MNSIPKYSDPFLLIVHVSDMHVVSKDYSADDTRLNRLGSIVYRHFSPENHDDGIAESDPKAIEEFEKFLDSKVNEYFPNVVKWIVDTGDMSNWGDDNSLILAQQSLNNFRDIISADKLIQIYGNHDSWPGQHPFGTLPSTLATRREVFRNSYFKTEFPEGPYIFRIPNSNSELQLFNLNSVVHLPWHENIAALGRVEEDMYWKKHNGNPLPEAQLTTLHNLVQSSQGSELNKHIRIALTHHPVHFPAKKPRFSMSLVNDVRVAEYLSGGIGGIRNPHFQLVLSGHTHSIFPPLGMLPGNVSNCLYPPLKEGQCQLVIGSLSQRNFSGKAGPYAQQAQLLAFYSVENFPGTVAVQRFIAARNNGIGEYKFVPINSSHGQVLYEIIHISP